MPWKIIIFHQQIPRSENDTLGSDYPVTRDGKWLWIKKEPEGDVSKVLFFFTNLEQYSVRLTSIIPIDKNLTIMAITMVVMIIIIMAMIIVMITMMINHDHHHDLDRHWQGSAVLNTRTALALVWWHIGNKPQNWWFLSNNDTNDDDNDWCKC